MAHLKRKHPADGPAIGSCEMPGRVCVAVSVRTELAQALLKKAGFQVALLAWIPSRGRDKLVEGLDGADAFMIAGSETIDREIMAPCTKLQAIVKGGIGIERIDLDAATELGILVCNSPTPESVIGLAEATVGLIVALFKRLKLNEARLRSGQWKTLDSQGEVMAGKTIGLIGFGRIGRETAKRLGAWGVRLLASSPRATPEEAEVLGVTPVSLDELLRKSDLVTIHVVLTPETRHMITLGELRLMKPTRGHGLRQPAIVRDRNEHRRDA